MSEKIAVYSGTFDPVTNGHLDIIRRARALFDAVRVVIVPNPRKKPLFSAEERVRLIEQSLAGLDGVSVACYEGLLTDYMKEQGLCVIVRGLRCGAETEFESEMAHYNRLLYPRAETVFLPCSSQYRFLSSSAVREVYSHGKELPDLVPPAVNAALKEKYRK